mgnify:CR=1 FL=1
MYIILLTIILLPLLAAFLLFFVNNNNNKLIRTISIYSTSITFFISIFLLNQLFISKVYMKLVG